MNVNFYKISFIRNQVVKTLGTTTALSVSLKDSTDVHDPVLYLDHNAAHMDFNYCYIADFGRYYFVDPPVIDGKIDIFACHEDVLMTLSADIKNSNVIATRSQFRNKQLHDPMIVEQADEFIECRKLGDSLTGDSYVLILGG